MDRIGADRAQHQDERRDDAEGDAQDGRENRHAGQHDEQADDIAEIHRGNQAPDEFLLFDEQHRSGLQAPDQEAAEQHGRRR